MNRYIMKNYLEAEKLKNFGAQSMKEPWQGIRDI